MKSSTTTSNIRPYNSKQLLFEEEQKKRAAKRDSVLGNLQSTGAAAPQSAAAQTKPAVQGGIVQTKPASLVSSGKQNSGGIIQMKPNAFSPNARTANAAAGMVKSDNSSTVRMQSTGSTGNLQKPRRTPNMTRGEAWGMLENERKDKRSFSVPSGFSEQGKDVFMQLMELPDWGLDGSESKKHEKVVELKRSVPETSAAKTKEGPTLEETALKRIASSTTPFTENTPKDNISRSSLHNQTYPVYPNDTNAKRTAILTGLIRESNVTFDNSDIKNPDFHRNIDGPAKDITEEFNNVLDFVTAKYSSCRELPFWEKWQMLATLFPTGAEYDLKSRKDLVFGQHNKEPFVYNGQRISYDAPGNILYGYFSKMLGISDIVSRLGAAGQQFIDGTINWEFWKTYFDDPSDQDYIALGMELYDLLN